MTDRIDVSHGPTGAPVRLTVESTGEAVPVPRWLADGGEATLGRGADSDIVVADPSVSRRHAVVGTDRGTVLVRDVGSTNGTRLDGQPVGAVPVRLRPGQVLQVGYVRLRVEPAAAGRDPDTATGATAGPVESRPEGRTARWVAVVLAATAVVGAVVGVLTYLQSRPSSVEAYRADVVTLCRTAAARQVQFDSAITGQGYDRRLFTDLARQLPTTDGRIVQDLQALKPPDELAEPHAQAVTMAQQVTAAERDYVDSLAALPDSEFRKPFPLLPGNTQPLTTAVQQLGGALVSLSGGRCEVRKT